MCMYPFAKKALTLHLARGEGPERYFGCNLMHRSLLVVFWCVLDVRRASHELLVSDALDVVLRFPFQVRPHLRPIHWHIVLE